MGRRRWSWIRWPAPVISTASAVQPYPEIDSCTPTRSTRCRRRASAMLLDRLPRRGRRAAAGGGRPGLRVAADPGRAAPARRRLRARGGPPERLLPPVGGLQPARRGHRRGCPCRAHGAALRRPAPMGHRRVWPNFAPADDERPRGGPTTRRPCSAWSTSPPLRPGRRAAGRCLHPHGGRLGRGCLNRQRGVGRGPRRLASRRVLGLAVSRPFGGQSSGNAPRPGSFGHHPPHAVLGAWR